MNILTELSREQDSHAEQGPEPAGEAKRTPAKRPGTQAESAGTSEPGHVPRRPVAARQHGHVQGPSPRADHDVSQFGQTRLCPGVETCVGIKS